jgi:hypothetical protein
VFARLDEDELKVTDEDPEMEIAVDRAVRASHRLTPAGAICHPRRVKTGEVVPRTGFVAVVLYRRCTALGQS